MAKRTQPTPCARELAYRILVRVEASDGYSNLLLRALPQEMERRERALCTELVLGTLRWRGRLDHALAQCSRRPLQEVDAALLTTLRMGAYQLFYLDRVPDSAAVNESVRLARRAGGRGAAGFVNAVLRALLRQEIRWPGDETDPVQRLAVQTSHPSWLVQRWLDRLGPEEAEPALLAHNQPSPMVLRVNRQRTDPGALRSRLEAEGVQTQPGRWSGEALHVSGGNPMAGDAFREGLFYVQDEASILVADLVGAQPGDRIADFCAAPGGKATQLAAVLKAKGMLLACDLRPTRLALVDDNAGRLGLDSLRLVVQDAGLPGIRPESLDRALLDAPCTGTGVLRRRPEIRWRRQPEDVLRLASLQARLLEAVAGTVRPGGRLVYSVCSLEPEEGPEVVQQFLRRRSDYHIGQPENVPAALVEGGHGLPHLRTQPQRHGLDGFFAAVLQRDAR